MSNRKTLESNSGFSLVQVDEVDENGKVLSTSYEVVDPNGKIIGTFRSRKEAQDFIKSVLPKPPRPRGPRM